MQVWRLSRPLKWVCLFAFNTTFNSISVISWQSILLVEETRGLQEIHPPVEVTGKSNYHTVMATMTSKWVGWFLLKSINRYLFWKRTSPTSVWFIIVADWLQGERSILSKIFNFHNTQNCKFQWNILNHMLTKKWLDLPLV